jgi:hypothetical protein
MKRFIFFLIASSCFCFNLQTIAQTSVLEQGLYYPLNGSYPNTGFAVDDICTSLRVSPFQPCNRGTTDEAGVVNGAYLFRGNAYSPNGQRLPYPGNYFPYVNNSLTNFNNGLTVAFSYKMTKEGDPSALEFGGTVIDGTFEIGITDFERYRRGFSITAGNSGVTFNCYFGWNGGGNFEDWQTVNSAGITGIIPPFLPDTGIWYHVICQVKQDPSPFGGNTTMSIYINGNLKGEKVLLYRPELYSNGISIGASVRPNNTQNNPCYQYTSTPTSCSYPLYNSSNAYNVFNNNPYLIRSSFVGALDEFRLYDRAVNASEISEIYNARLTSPVPAISSYTPSSLKAGANLTIIGNNFSQATSVLINGTSADSISIISNDSIRAKVPNPTNSSDSTVIVSSVKVVNDDGNAVRYGNISANVINTPAPPRPGIIISGPSSACGLTGSDSVVTYRITDTLPSTYLWRVSTSNIIVVGGLSADTLRVKFKSTFTSGVIYVKRMRPGDTSNLSLIVTNTIPARPTLISGNRNVCNYTGTGSGTPSRYTIRRTVGAIEYLWTLPIGASIQGVSISDSTYITQDTAINLIFTSGFTSGTLKVRSINSCGSSTEISLLLTTIYAPIPGAITGSTDVCSSMISDSLPAGIPVTYRVRRNATYSGYEWSVPNHVTIIDYPGGQGTNTDTSITVVFDSSFVSGNISVRGVTPCFTTNPRNLSITRRLPSYRLITVASSSLTCPTRSIQYQTLPITYASWYEWSVPSNGSIDGRSDTTQITVNYTTAASLASDRVRLRGVNNCGKGSWTSIPVRLPACSASFAKIRVTDIEKTDFSLNVVAFPNPSRTLFNLNWTSENEMPVLIKTCDITGKIIQQKQVSGFHSIMLGQNYRPGIYLVQIKQGTQNRIVRLIKY